MILIEFSNTFLKHKKFSELPNRQLFATTISCNSILLFLDSSAYYNSWKMCRQPLHCFSLSYQPLHCFFCLICVYDLIFIFLFLFLIFYSTSSVIFPSISFLHYYFLLALSLTTFFFTIYLLFYILIPFLFSISGFPNGVVLNYIYHFVHYISYKVLSLFGS